MIVSKMIGRMPATNQSRLSPSPPRLSRPEWNPLTIGLTAEPGEAWPADSESADDQQNRRRRGRRGRRGRRDETAGGSV